MIAAQNPDQAEKPKEKEKKVLLDLAKLDEKSVKIMVMLMVHLI